MAFRVEGLGGFWVEGLGFRFGLRVWGSGGFRVEGVWGSGGVRVEGLGGFRVEGLGFRVQEGLVFRV